MSFRLAITQRVVENQAYAERRDALSQDWPAYLSAALPGAVILPLPNRPEGVEGFVEELDISGAILTGGNDWGAAPERDQTESRLVSECRARALPVLGVCRGLQALNFLLGGTIETDLESRTKTKHIASNHLVTLCGAQFLQMAGADKLEVNSYHDQGVTHDGLAGDCTAFALADDAVVEGFHHLREPILAVQWHPERPGPAAAFDQALITRLFADGAWWRDSQRRSA